MRPISRTLAIWLGTIIILSGILVGVVHVSIRMASHEASYLDDVRDRADFMAQELAIDLWAYNELSIAHLSQTAINISNIDAIQVRDEAGRVLFSQGDAAAPNALLIQKKIQYRSRPIGEIQLAFAPFDPSTVWWPTLTSAAAVLVPVLLASVLLTFIVLKFFLSRPLNDLLRGIRSISEGRYETRIAVGGGRELGIIADSVNRLSKQLRQREQTLKEKESKLQESLEKYRVLFSAFPLGIGVTDPAGAILETNAKAETLLGVGEQDCDRRSLYSDAWHIIRPDGTRLPKEAYASISALREKRLVENSEEGVVRPDGRVVWMNVIAAPIPLANYGVVVAYGDITERRRLEKDLHAYRNIVSSTDDLIALVDPEYVYRIVNDSYLKLNRMRAKEILGHTVGEVLGESLFQETLKSRIDRCLSGKVVRFQSWVNYFGTRKRYMDFTYSPYREDGVIRGVAINGRDITDLKRTEDQLKELNATLEERISERTALAEHRTQQLRSLAMELSAAEDRERRRLAAVLHDDLQQHLAYIKVRARLAATPPDGGIDSIIQREFEEIEGLVQESITKCRNLCYDLTPPELYREGLLAALECTIDDFRERYGLDIELSADPDSEPESSILSSMLFRSIRELLNNIAKHAGADTATIEISREDGEIRVSVADAGTGCDIAEVRSRRGSEAGFGLFNIADRMTFLGGGAKFTSAEGQGFQASLWVPNHSKVPGHPPSLLTEIPRPDRGAVKAAAAPDGTGTIRILIVDDHDLMRAGLAELIQGHPDLQVAGEAADGVEAVRLAAEIQPDVILMDVSMPQMNGIDASAEILRTNPAIRIIGISMNTDAATRRRMRQAGACAFFSKAGSFEELILEIRRARKDLPCAG